MAADLEALRQLLAGRSRVLIVTHDNPDPDALASACALARLFGALGSARCRIVCEGVVGRAENQALVRELRLRLTPPRRLGRRWPLTALVDTQPRASNNCLPPNHAADIVIDHHPLRADTHARYVDVRPEAGACATVLVEYLRAAQAPLDPALAAGLCYAISSETQSLSRETTPQDMDAYAFLYPLADKRRLARILYPPLKNSYYSILAQALMGAFVHANVIGTHLDEIDHPDSVSLVADLLLRRERSTWSIVTGVWNDALYVSLRTENHRPHAGRLLQRMVRPTGSAGGHAQVAGGRIPLKEVGPAERRALQDSLVQKLIYAAHGRKEGVVKPLIPPERIAGVYRPPADGKEKV